MITTTIAANISRDDRATDRRVTCELYSVAEGSRVSLFVGDRWIVDPETADQLRQYVSTLHIDVHGSVRAATAWAAALRDPNWAAI